MKNIVNVRQIFRVNKTKKIEGSKTHPTYIHAKIIFFSFFLVVKYNVSLLVNKFSLTLLPKNKKDDVRKLNKET